MIFNRNNTGSAELRALTGNYYMSNEFEKVESEIKIVTSIVSDLIGSELYKSVESDYSEGIDNELIELVQRPIAIYASLRMYRKNDLSHEDTGRKFKMATDDSEKLPWEWQLDRDDAIMLDSYYESVEILLRHLVASNNELFKKSSTYIESSGLLISSGRVFDRYFSIQKSERLYYSLLPTIREVQMRYIAPAYGQGFSELVDEKTVPESELHFAACMATALLSMSISLRRGPIQLIPHAVIRGYMAENGARNSEPASIEDVYRVAQSLQLDAQDWIEKMKVIKSGGADERPLIPSNDPNNKYMRL